MKMNTDRFNLTADEYLCMLRLLLRCWLFWRFVDWQTVIGSKITACRMIDRCFDHFNTLLSCHCLFFSFPAEKNVIFYLNDAVTQLLGHKEEYTQFGVVRYFAE